MPEGSLEQIHRPEPGKFSDPTVTAKGETRATVTLGALRTVWFNTGSLCNITCDNCYIESSPKNDRLAYIAGADVAACLDEILQAGMPVEEIGFTGGEPFMNPEFPAMLADALARGYRALVLTNAMRPLLNKRDALLPLRELHGDRLTLRVSIDHYTPEKHEAVRGPGTWAPMMEGIGWLAGEGFDLAVAGRTLWGEDEAAARAGYADLFAREGIPVDSANPGRLVLFPEMDSGADVPEITEACWGILGANPDDMMCATSRMVVKRRGADTLTVVPCTLLPYDPRFELGTRLTDSEKTVSLNHPHCARFCVLGGASCSSGG